MTRFAGIVACVLCLAAAHADVTPNPSKESEKVPQSIWQVARDGTATHLQSTLVCAPEVGDFRQVHLQVYDRHGLDVSCGYNGRGGLITVYLTRIAPMSLNAAFDDAKRQLLQNAPDAKPLADADQKTFEGAKDFLHLIYTEKNGALWSGIWMADFSGWMFEFRATYKPEAQQDIFDELAELTRRARADAGAHLALCAKSAVPERSGTVITDQAEVATLSLMLGSLAFEAGIPVQDEKGNSKGEIKPKQPDIWCAETPVGGFKLPILLWHAVTADGQLAPFDQVTVSTYDASPALQSRVSDIGILFDATAKDGKSRFAITMRQGDTVFLYGVYAGRPKSDELGRIMDAYFAANAKPVASVNVKTNTITMYQDPKK